MSFIRPVLAALILGGSLHAVDAVIVDAEGNTTFTGSVKAPSIVGNTIFAESVKAPNILQGAAGVGLAGTTVLPATAFGSWHWVTGSADYVITLPTAVGHAGKMIGFRVPDAVSTTRRFVLAATGSQKIDGVSSLVLATSASVILMSDGAGWSRIGGTVGSGSPPGAVMDFAMQTPPAGWLVCDGSAVSRTTYAALFAAIGTTYGTGNGTTTFTLPDLRGEFRRGWDGGRNVDAGRVFASAQADAFKNHGHPLGSTHRVQLGVDNGTSYGVRTDGSATENFVSTTGGTETRPRNIAMLSCIKY